MFGIKKARYWQMKRWVNTQPIVAKYRPRHEPKQIDLSWLDVPPGMMEWLAEDSRHYFAKLQWIRWLELIERLKAASKPSPPIHRTSYENHSLILHIKSSTIKLSLEAPHIITDDYGSEELSPTTFQLAYQRAAGQPIHK